jgi:predicted ester cyclase
MGLEDIKAVARCALEGVWSCGGLVPAEEVYASGVVSHQHSHPRVGDVHGIEALKSFIAEFQTAFPDFLDTVERQVAEGDLVTTQFTSAGTHRGEFLGIAATGQRVEWMGVEIARVEGAKIIENWVSWDMYGVLQQLGALPVPGVARGSRD